MILQTGNNIQKNPVLLLGNEAIARGTVEAGIGFATSYPGTPSSEVGDTLSRVAVGLGIKFLYSVNEKVAPESAFDASLTSIRSLVFMKHVGLNVASDRFIYAISKRPVHLRLAISDHTKPINMVIE